MCDGQHATSIPHRTRLQQPWPKRDSPFSRGGVRQKKTFGGVLRGAFCQMVGNQIWYVIRKQFKGNIMMMR